MAVSGPAKWPPTPVVPATPLRSVARHPAVCERSDAVRALDPAVVELLVLAIEGAGHRAEVGEAPDACRVPDLDLVGHAGDGPVLEAEDVAAVFELAVDHALLTGGSLLIEGHVHVARHPAPPSDESSPNPCLALEQAVRHPRDTATGKAHNERIYDLLWKRRTGSPDCMMRAERVERRNYGQIIPM